MKNKNYKYEQKRPMSTAKKWLVGIVTALLLVGCVGGITYGVMANFPKEETPPVEQTTPPVTEDSTTTETPTTLVEPVVPDVEQDTRQIPINYKLIIDGNVCDSQEFDLLAMSNNNLDVPNELSISKVTSPPDGVGPGRKFEYFVNGNKCIPVPNGSEPSDDNIFCYKIKNLYIMFTNYGNTENGISYRLTYTENLDMFRPGINFIDTESIDFVVTFDEPTTSV